MPLLKRITKDQEKHVVWEIHGGICRNHSEARKMTVKVLMVGYYVQNDCVEYVKKCIKCQEFGPFVPSQARSTSQHDIAITVHHVGNGHH